MFKALVAGVILGASSLPATATVVHAVITGTVYGSSDRSGLFGLGAASSLDGLPITLDYQYEGAVDPSAQLQKYYRNTTNWSDRIVTGRFGAAEPGHATPYDWTGHDFTATITINGHSEQIRADYQGSVQINAWGSQPGKFSAGVYSHRPCTSSCATRIDYVWAFGTGLAGMTPNLVQPWSGLEAGGFGGFSLIDTNSPVIEGNPIFPDNIGSRYVQGSFTVTSVVLRAEAPLPSPASIPLPGGMALALGGLAAFGLLARQRRV